MKRIYPKIETWTFREYIESCCDAIKKEIYKSLKKKRKKGNIIVNIGDQITFQIPKTKDYITLSLGYGISKKRLL